MTEPPWSDLARRVRAHPHEPALHQECLLALWNTATLGDRTWLEKYHADLDAILVALFDGDIAKHQLLEPVASLQLVSKYQLECRVKRELGPQFIDLLAADPLFEAVMQKTFVTLLGLEEFLTALRHQLLTCVLNEEPIAGNCLKLVCMIARQCFNNEYVWWQSDAELAATSQLKSRLDSLGDGNSEDLQLLRSVLGMYRPLAESEWAIAAAIEQPAGLAEPFRNLLAVTVLEPIEVRSQASSIASIGPISNRVSQEVRAHYEANPFPRWHNLGSPFPPLLQRLKVLGGLPYPVAEAKRPVRQVLVAGCGTGQQPLAMACADTDTEYTAIDLSLASLSYAKQMAMRLGIKNVNFVHMDLLDVAELGLEFHHVECVGVLHCLESPELGWEALSRVTLPGGTWHIGVYSRMARMPLQRVRVEIMRRGMQPSIHEMREMRKILIEDERFASVRPYLLDRDFFSLSMFRDLLFHQHEHQYTLEEIEQQTRKVGGRFVAFQALAPLMDKYRNFYPDDPCGKRFENWKAFEPHYAGSREMFRFWLQFSPEKRMGHA